GESRLPSPVRTYPTGTCRMGTSEQDSVVDSRLRVHGIKNLRVVDCSAMPTPPSGNTNGPAMMLGWRAAELILEDRARGEGSEVRIEHPSSNHPLPRYWRNAGRA